MTTRNLVPRADGEGSLGTAAKQWGAMRAKNIYIDGVDVTEAVTSTANNAKAAATSATNASNSASSASTTATQLMEYLEDKETLTAPAVDPTLTISGAAADAKVTGNKIINLNKMVNGIATYPNLANPVDFVAGKYVAKDGSEYANADFFHTAKIAVEEGQSIKVNHRARFITAYSDNTADASSGVDDPSGGDTTITYVVPTGINGIVLSFENDYATDLMIYVYNGIDYDYIPYGEVSYINPRILQTPFRVLLNKESRPVYKQTSDTAFLANTFISLPIFACARKNTRLVFRAEIGLGLGNFEIGFTTSANASGTKYNRFVITRNTVIAYLRYDYPTSSMISETVTHNLDVVSGMLQIIVEEHSNATVTLTIENNGNRFKHTFEGYVKNNTLQPYCFSAYGAFVNYKFVWSNTDLYKSIWIFGDSYMAYEPERWAYYLEEYNYAQNVLLNSFPGCWSSIAVTALNSLINYGNPKFAVWGLGMNDGTDSADAPSASWATGRDNFLSVCESNDIEPIFCTIPTVPTINHEQKNAWIRSSGYRYIDFARAVNASSSGVWTPGTLSGDGVHPTINGARALFAEVLLDFPEIMQNE